MAPNTERLIYTGLAIVCGVAAGLLPPAREFLLFAAGTLFGKAHFSKPGDLPAPRAS